MSISFNFDELDLCDVEKSLSVMNPLTRMPMVFMTKTKTTVNIPFAYAVKYLAELSKPTKRPQEFLGTLNDIQASLFDKAIDCLDEERACVICSPPGFGKTVMGVAIAGYFGLETTIVVNRIVLRNQWKETIDKFMPNLNYKFVNVQHVKYIPKTDFLIVDELHQNLSMKSFPKYMNLHPNYILGLSATPYRYDVWDKCIPHLFGRFLSTSIEEKQHNVYIFYTEISFKCRYDFRGKIIWSDLITKQSVCEPRNKLIAKSIHKYGKLFNVKYWLVLCKRLDQINILERLLESQPNPVIKASPKIDYNSLSECIILGTPSRLGVGFNMTKIDGLCLASDLMNYFPQYMGRLRKGKCLILDFVDNNPTFHCHLDVRKDLYRKHKCLVKTI